MEEVKKELKDLVESLNKGIDETTKELGKQSLRYMQKQYSENNLEKYASKIDLKSYKHNYKKGFIISSGDDDAVNEKIIYNEFGIGMIGAKDPNPLASDAHYSYNLSSLDKGRAPDGAKKQWGEEYCIKVTTPDTWWYFKNGKWWHSRGYKGKQMYFSLVDELRKVSPEKYKTSVNQTIGNYNSINTK